MAYDLLTGKLTPRRHNRDNIGGLDTPSIGMVAFLGIGLSAGVLMLKHHLDRLKELAYYHREFTQDDMRTTQSMPAISMRDLMREDLFKGNQP